MGMMLEVLTPGMKDSEHTDACTEMTGIGSDREQGLGSCTKQQGIEEPLVAQPQPGQLFGHGEHNMDIRHRQQASSLLDEPAIAG
jgi:hypothetical protein